MRNYPLKLDEFGLTREEYQELYWFCKQYPHKKQKLSYLLNPSESTGIVEAHDEHGRLIGVAMPHGSGTTDKTLTAVIKREALLKDCEVIEQAAIETDAHMYQAIIRNVTLSETYERIGPPCGRRQFFEKRRQFFYILWLKRQNGILGGNT
jgi:hypothetical protein